MARLKNPSLQHKNYGTNEQEVLLAMKFLIEREYQRENGIEFKAYASFEELELESEQGSYRADISKTRDWIRIRTEKVKAMKANMKREEL